MSYDSDAYDTSAYDESAYDIGAPFVPDPTTGRSSGGFVCGVGRLMTRALIPLLFLMPF